METATGIPCTLVNPSKFSGLPLSGTVKVKVTARIDGEKIDFISSPGGEPRSITSETIQNINKVVVKRFSVRAQILALLRASALRLGVIAALFILWRAFTLAGRDNDLGYYLAIILVVVLLMLPFSFLLGGGLGIRDDILRFSFFGQAQDRLFYMEVGGEQETSVRQALEAAGVKVEGDKDSPYESLPPE